MPINQSSIIALLVHEILIKKYNQEEQITSFVFLIDMMSTSPLIIELEKKKKRDKSWMLPKTPLSPLYTRVLKPDKATLLLQIQGKNTISTQVRNS